MVSILLLTFIFNLSANSQDYLEACSSSPQYNDKVLKSFLFIFNSKDRYKKSTNCFEVFTSDTRSILYQKFLKQKHPSIQLNVISNKSEKYCHLELTEETRQGVMRGLISNKQLNLHNKDKTSSSIMKLKTLENQIAAFTIGDQNINYRCRLESNGARVEVTSQKFKTSQFLPYGQKLLVFEVIQDKSGRDTYLISPSHIGYSKIKKQSLKKVYLKLSSRSNFQQN